MKYEITARRLRQALENKDLRPIDLSERTGIAKSSISQYCNGIHAPSNLTAGAMAEVLGVDPLWLMGFDVPEKPADPDKENNSLWTRVSADPKLVSALEKYLSLPQDKKDVLLTLVDMLSKG